MKSTLFSFCTLLLVIGISLPVTAQYTVTTITAIQDGSGGFTFHTNSGNPSAGAQLEVRGIVTALGGSGNSFYLQEAAAPYAGIRVYPGSVNVTALQIGDDVSVQGHYVEYFGETEISLEASLIAPVIHSTGNTVWDPLVIPGSEFIHTTANNALPAEQYEGCLVRINNVTITDLTSPGFGEVLGTDDGGTSIVRFNDEFLTTNYLTNTLQVGQTYHITGIAHYTFSNYKIEPRSPADIVLAGSDTTPPELNAAEPVGRTRVVAVFSEPMGDGVDVAANYSINQGIGVPSEVEVLPGSFQVVLTVAQMSSGVSYTLTVNNVEDAAGNPISSSANTATFSFTIPSVTINEVMYDSITPGVSDREWVELYNTTGAPINIGGWALCDAGVHISMATLEGHITIPAGTIIPAYGYLVVSGTDSTQIPGVVVCSMTRSFQLGNSGDNIALYNGTGEEAVLIDGSLTVFYPALAGSNTGDSIEKIDETFPWSGNPAAWRVARVPAGYNPSEYRYASPGRQNDTTIFTTGTDHWEDYR